MSSREEAGTVPRQLALPFPMRAARGREAFHLAPPNARAAAAVADPDGWPGGRLALVGPAGAGKTHLAHVALAAAPSVLLAASALEPMGVEAAAAPGLAVIEDVDRLAALPERASKAAEEGLFHLFNLSLAGQTRLLVTGRSPPARWQIRTPDLASRLSSLDVVAIAPPDDALLSSVLVKQGRDRGLDITTEAAAHVSLRIERSFAAVTAAADALDQAATARRRRKVGVQLAAQVTKSLLGPADGTAGKPADRPEDAQTDTWEDRNAC
ncbi:MAG: DnaA/Hda family protein [Pseudomonadota bacterium]